MNRYPQISKRLGRPIDELKEAVKRLSRLHPHRETDRHDDAPPITPDAFIHLDEDSGRYEIKMANDPAESLYIGGRWRKMLKEKNLDKKTKEFLTNTCATRGGFWNRSSSAEHDRAGDPGGGGCAAEFFEKGPEF